MASIADGVYYLVNGYRGGGSWAFGEKNVYRVYNPNPGWMHLFTTNWGEVAACVSEGWRYEGVAWRTSKSANVPVYRLYHYTNGDHLLTTSKDEYDRVSKWPGWRGEGVAFYVDASGNWPVYRNYNPNSGEHFYTTSKAEWEDLGSKGWDKEDVAFYGMGLLCLDAAGWNNGANVALGSLAYAPSQQWRVTNNSDGTIRILSVWNGRSLDLPGYNATAGTNVQMYDSDSGRDQLWKVERQTGTHTVDGVSAPVYRLRNAAKASYDLGAASTTVGGNVAVQAASSNLAQTWAFVPVSGLQDGGVYEIRAYRNTGLAVDNANGSRTDGSNARLWTVNHSNTEKWVFERRDGDNWRVWNASGGKCLDVAGGKTTTSGTNVQNYTANDARAQVWKVTTHGTVRVDGKACPVVTFGAGGADACMMSAANAVVNQGANVNIMTADGTDSQRWVLWRTTATGSNVPTATDLYLNSAVGRWESGDRAYQERLYPGWRATDGWANANGSNHYRFRWRRRLLTAGGWTGWGPWTAAREVPVTRDGDHAWVTEGIDTSYDTTQYRNEEVQFEVTAVTASGASQRVGAPAVGTHRVFPVPAITFSDCGMSPAGMYVSYASDYTLGANVIWVTGVTIDGVQRLTGGPVRVATDRSGRALDSTASILVPAKNLSRWPGEGSKVTITYQPGTDQHDRMDWRTWTSDTLTCSYATGHGADLELSMKALRHTELRLTIASGYANVTAWMNTRPENVPLALARDGDGYVVKFPQGRTFDLYAAYQASDSDEWAVGRILSITPARLRWLGIWAAHRFYARGTDGQLLLAVFWNRDDPVQDERSATADADTVRLNGRTYDTVRWDGGVSEDKTVTGCILERDGYTADSVRALLGKRVRYSGPHGDEFDAFVADTRTSRFRGGWDVSIKVTRESS